MASNAKKYKIKIRELILTNAKSSGCETFVYEPSNIEEEPFGNLYVLGSIKNENKDLDFLPNLIASLAKREFYKLTGISADASFELMLKKANATILDIAKEHPDLKKKISICLINTDGENNIRFSQIGKHFIHLLRNESLLKLNKEESNNLFSSVVAGALMPRDKYIFATEKMKELLVRQGGIVNILQNKADVQAEIISDLYEKESDFPAQAAILIEIGPEAKTKTLIQNVFETNSENTEARDGFSNAEEDYDEKGKTTWKNTVYNFFNKRKLFRISAFLIVGALYGVSLYAQVSSAKEILNQVNLKISEAENKTNTDRKEAIEILNNSKGAASALYSYPFFTKTAKALENKIASKINEVNGVFNIDDMQNIGNITGKSIGFKPKFIFENSGDVYVFGEKVDVFYKIKQGETSGFFNFMESVDFETERAFSENNIFYFLNYIGEQAYYFNPKTEEIEPISKKLNKVLQIKPTPYEKQFGDNAYALDKNQMTKTPLGDGIEKYFNFLNLTRIRDFTISNDEKYIYLLAESQVYKMENK